MYYYCWVSDQLQRLDAGTFIQLYFKLFQCEPTLMALVLLHVTSTEKVSLLFFFYHLTLFHKSKVTKTLKKNVFATCFWKESSESKLLFFHMKCKINT